jgi:hypothetical protein
MHGEVKIMVFDGDWKSHVFLMHCDVWVIAPRPVKINRNSLLPIQDLIDLDYPVFCEVFVIFSY